tara:strand:- start:770 stop:961 length:192 start_codon:yes stop_codon:yes gene_type:complete
MKKSDLMHYRLQAWLRENRCDDISYIGIKTDNAGEEKHFYKIGQHEVPHDCIESLEMEEVEEE